ncbi:ENHANCER OF POLYCOMB-LIKE PROTEIN [Salix purpurea]|uniref:Enhancer of polycomb-like protein n=1 Tax=Salix purpurea TaxID=77065 RepID=A0A9Q0TTP4_SALPP|nr:ENHANCER OF POLYCOMB-LIKE PROTEIN [Salix purpurea]KAJ6717535.1 ENHANCER OF POLYCOMB-LIKE PROTEIN [Salix purpurea]
MPSVGLRRTTRVFGVIKGVDGARVLRSGRRLWPESCDGKLRRNNDGDEWYHTIIKKANNYQTKNQNKNSDLKYKENSGWAHDDKLKKDLGVVIAIAAPKRIKKVKSEKKFGIVYRRKRKRLDGEKGENEDDKKYGIQFSRRQRRRQDGESLESLECTPELVVLVERFSCSSRSNGLSCFLSSVLRYIKRVILNLSDLADFLSSEPISSVFASNGLHFVRDLPADRIGICKFFETRQFLPMFSVDFSSIPSCFVNMHLSLFVRFKFLSPIPVNNSLDDDDSDDDVMMSGSKVDQSWTTMKTDFALKITAMPEIDNFGSKAVVHPSVRASKLTGRSTQYRNGLNSRGIQKRRSSLRRGRPRNSSIACLHKANGALVSDLISSRRNGIPFSSVVSKNKLRRSTRGNLAENIKEMNSDAVGVKKDLNMSSCSANILVSESDRCYRLEGATIMFELSDSREWVLVVKKDGLTRYTHLALKSMRTCASNRFTHDIIWTGDDNWKLEFPNRQDWFIFKELYKECSDCNVPASFSKVISVPGVQEVLDYENGGGAPFFRPYAYISFKNDEVARALARSTASYDMDSEDEEWLKKYNNGVLVGSDHLSEDDFELLIDALEKSYYINPVDFTDENAAAKYCKDFGRREVDEAVYGYWMKKRKQKCSPLLRVFQGHQVQKTPLIPKSVLRKRRSFKRPPGQFRRGKQPCLFQAMAAGQGTFDGHNAMHEIEEAENSVKRSLEAAILKRRRAQLLMKNAELATYKAAMALKIAEAALVANSTEVAVTHLCD